MVEFVKRIFTSPNPRGRQIFSTLLGVMVAAFVALGLGRSEFFENLELATYDLRMISGPKVEVSEKLTFLDIDDQSLELIGRWPWSRDKFKTLLEILKKFGVDTVMFDVEFIGESVGFLDSSDIFKRLITMSRRLKDELDAQMYTVEGLWNSKFKLTNDFRKAVEADAAQAGTLSGMTPAEMTAKVREWLESAMKSLDESSAFASDFLNILTKVNSSVQELNDLLEFNLLGPDDQFAMGLMAFKKVFLAFHFLRALDEEGLKLTRFEDRLADILRKNPEARIPDIPADLLAQVDLEAARRVYRLHRAKEFLKKDVETPFDDISKALDMPAGSIDDLIEEARRRAIFEVTLDFLDSGAQETGAALVKKVINSMIHEKSREMISDKTFAHVAEQAETTHFIRRTSGYRVSGLGYLDFHTATSMDAPPLNICRRASMAHINAFPDSDGIFRSAPLFYKFKDRAYPQIAFASFLAYNGYSGETIEVTPNRICRVNLPGIGGGQPRVLEIPLTPKGEVMINWAGEYGRRFDHLSLAAVLGYDMSVQEKRREIRMVAEQYSGGIFEGIERDLDSARSLLEKAPDGMAGDYPQLAKYPPDRPLKELVATIEKDRQAEIDNMVTALNHQLAMLAKGKDRLKDRPDKLESLLAREATMLNDRARLIESVKWVQKTEKTLEQKLNGRICVIGMSATSTTDIGAIPFQKSYPMMGLHGNLINTLTTGKFIRRQPEGYEFLILVFLGLVTGYTIPSFKIMKGASICFGIALLYTVYAFNVFWGSGLWVKLAAPLMVIVTNYTIISIIRFITEEREKRFIKGAFSQYLAPTIIEQIMNDPSKLRLGGERLVCTAFFSDVAGFSSFSEKLTPEELVALLNQYLTEMTNIILRYEGTVDKYEGDAIIAIFGAPINYADHAKRACYVSIDMQKLMVQMRKKWAEEGRQQLHMRIGLNTGPMVVGNMGSIQRMDYTMMGDTVNLASRLEGANKPYGTYTMISQFVYAHCKDDVEVRELDKIRVVGKKEPVTVYELLDRKGELEPEVAKIVESYNKALALYKERNWQEALKAFEATLAIEPSDGPALAYVERCKQFFFNPPPDDWDGVYVLKSK